MNMKSLLTILLSISVLCSSLSAVEYGRLTTRYSDPESDSIELAEGDVLEVIYFYGPAILNHIIDETTGASFSYDHEDLHFDLTNSPGANIQSERIIVGPGRIFLVYYGTTNARTIYYCGYKLTRRSEIDNKSVTILSIPSESVSSGNSSLVVEGSDDLGSWDVLHTSHLSGSTQAFFRTTIKTIVE